MDSNMKNLEAAWDMGYKWGSKGFYGSVPKPWRNNSIIKARWKLAQREGQLVYERNDRMLLVQGWLFDV